MALAERARELLDGLPRDWAVARLDVSVEDPAHADRAALILAPATPGRAGSTFRLHVQRGAGGASPELVRRVLSRLEEEGIRARVMLAGHEEAAPPAPAASAPAERDPSGLAAQWDRLVERLPADWSDLYAEVELESSDFTELAALRLSPVNPTLVDGERTFRFRVARRFGYGAAPQMARRSLARLDEEGITGRVRILNALSDTKPVATQGPVWRIGGKAV